MHIRKNDRVVVLTGNDTDKTGKVLRIITKKDRVVVEGINLRYKHVRRSQASPQGGRVRREMPIHVSKVLLFCEKCERGVRTRKKLDGDRKIRVCVKCGQEI